MLAQEIIRTKRDGDCLTDDAIAAFVRGLCDGSWSEGQIAALAMAMFLRGMNPEETARLTLAMADSGDRLAWEDLPGPIVDKHSTGGIGDKTSLILAPILAACGCFVPMLSGRGLGHTGGTLDKLDAVPGYRSAASLGLIRRTVRQAGCAIIGPTAALAPADRRLYAIRDVTGTVESIALITSSILSKKLAAGTAHLVMDVKYGSGAFLPCREDARALGHSIVEVAARAGLPTRALLTDMNMCLGHSAGNTVEVAEAVEILTGSAGSRSARLVELTLSLAAELLDMAGISHGRAAAEDALSSGRAAERFAEMVALLGGPANFLDDSGGQLPVAPVLRTVAAGRSGFVGSIDARALGVVILGLGGGRRRPDDPIDPAVGLTDLLEVGTAITPDMPLAVIHARSEHAALVAEAELRTAFCLTPEPPPPLPLVADRLTRPAAGR